MKLLDANQLLEQLFEENSRPSLRWLRAQQANGNIPFYKLGHLVRFDLEEVRESLKKSNP